MEFTEDQTLLVTHILQSIFFCVQQKKELYAGLEQPGEIMTEFSFLDNPFL